MDLTWVLQACCNSLLGHAILSLPQYVLMYFIHVHSYIHLYLCIYICTICTGILSSWPATTSASQDNGSVQRDKINLFIRLLFIMIVWLILFILQNRCDLISFRSLDAWILSRAAHAFMLCTWCAFFHDVSLCSCRVPVFLVCSSCVQCTCVHDVAMCS